MIDSARATALLERPSAISARTSCSLAVSRCVGSVTSLALAHVRSNRSIRAVIRLCCLISSAPGA
ncbi:hypothetical protein ACFQ0B_37345 [Nonomuraea thailandensis]